MNRGVLICTTVLLLVATCYSVATTSYTFSLTGNTTPFPHFWEQCVGSGHALLALRADYRSFLQRCRTELGFTHVRFHGLLDDDMSTYTTINGAPSTSFFNVDSIFDFLRSIDMRPVVEVSFMPELLASGNSTIMHYQGNITPPTSYPAWNQVIQELITHLVARYGIDEVRQWPFEIWNEPNCGFWTGTQQDYYDLYNNTAHAIKSVDSQLLVGGPATCQSAWLSDFVTYTTQNNIPLDFVSTHEYPTDMTPPLLSMTSVVSQARSEVGSLPLYYTEYNDGLYEPTFHDTSYAAAFIAKNAHDVQGYVDLWSWWTFSDIFEEQGFSSIPFNDPNGWGLLNRYGTAKPSYRAFQLLHQIGTEQLPSTNSTGSGSTVEAYATRQTTQGQKTRVDVVAININIPTNTGTSQTINIQVNGFPSGANIPTSATLNLIDPKHCNPAQLWEDLGSPMYPTPAQLDLLDVASMLSPTQIKLTVTGSSVTFSLTLLPQSVAFVSLEY